MNVDTAIANALSRIDQDAVTRLAIDLVSSEPDRLRAKSGDVPRRAHGKHPVRNTWDFSLSEVAVAVTPGAGAWDEVRIALGGMAPFPYRATAAEAVLVGRAPTAALVREAAEAAVVRARPLAMNGYKIDLTKTLVKRALTAVMA